MSKTQPIRVLIVDDHAMVRSGLKNFIHAYEWMAPVGEAANGADAVAFCATHAVDIVLMDMVMPGLDGISATREVLKNYPKMKIVMLTSFVEDAQVQNALEAGAVGYLIKNAPINTIADAIRAANAGQPALSPQATTALIRAKTGPLKPGQDLSKRELEVLALIVQGLNNDEIAKQLVISTATARHHVSACLQKLGAANRAQAAALATKYHLVP